MFYAFHVAIGAVFLPRRTVWLIGLLAGVLHTSMVLGEYFSLLPHHILTYTQPLHLPPHLHRTPHDMHLMPEFIVSYLVAYNLMLAGIIYLVQTVAEHQRAAEAQQRKSEHIAQSRERLARIGEISAGMAHTIRNPLHGVINAAEILWKKLPRNDRTAEEMIDLMQDGLGRIERVTSRLLALTRESAPRMVPTDIRALVNESLRFVESRAHKAGIRFEVDLGPLPPAVLLDPDRTFEALVNLLDNALGACSQGDLIQVTARSKWVPAYGVCIRIDDTGVGIPDADMAKVLDPFFTTKPVGEGSGLGLAITNRIVSEHGGELTLESKVGSGTQVQVFIPIRTAGSS
jgi:two-component system NtrC family sensor kinase